jgi:hypothetical protein
MEPVGDAVEPLLTRQRTRQRQQARGECEAGAVIKVETEARQLTNIYAKPTSQQINPHHFIGRSKDKIILQIT